MRPERPTDDAALTEKARWLVLTHGYCPSMDMVVELWEPSDRCTMRPLAFQRAFRSWVEFSVGPRGGDIETLATTLWNVSPHRPIIAGIHMRPDKPFPTYEEDGKVFKNTYKRPSHEGEGDITPWLDFMTHLLPKKAEREWFCDWLAHKWRNPGIPSVAVIMVAANADGPVYGTGRGFLRDIIARLLGRKYVKAVDFDVFAGKSAQAAYTDWAAYALLVTVSESKDTATSGRWSEQRAVYERLKELVDPRPVEKTFQVKGVQRFDGIAFASYLIASNNRDALQIPPDDRRVAALSNGNKMSTKMAVKLTAWMEVAGNIAVLARWLDTRNLDNHDAYAPLETGTKKTMQELARSELDDAFAAVRKVLGRAALFTGAQLQAAVLAEVGDGGEDLRRAIKRWIRTEATQVKAFRLTPMKGRHKILCWRGYDGIAITNEEVARKAVERTAEALKKASEDQAEGLGAQLVELVKRRDDDDG